jgi:hypothetical protein
MLSCGTVKRERDDGEESGGFAVSEAVVIELRISTSPCCCASWCGASSGRLSGFWCFRGSGRAFRYLSSTVMLPALAYFKFLNFVFVFYV